MIIRAAILALALLVAGCATPGPPTDVQHALAPTGALRVAVYVGTTTSVISNADRRGVGYDIGRDFARALHVPFAPMILEKNADVQAAIKAGTADVAFTNASPERARDMDFTLPYLTIELGYLAGPKTKVASLADVDRPGVRVGVTAGSSSFGLLSAQLKNAKVIAITTVDEGDAMLAAGTLDLYATNKATLYAMGDKLPGSHVLDGAWGVEKHAMGIPKGRDAGRGFAELFIDGEILSGRVKAASERAGLRGAVQNLRPDIQVD